MQAHHVDLGYRPRPWQQKCRRALKRFSVLVVHRRAGKTVLAIATLLDAALRTKKQNARYAYIAPLLKQAKTVSWDYICDFASKIPGVTINQSDLIVAFPNGAQIRLHGADNPHALRGIYLDGVVIDEVADMRPALWEEVIRPTLSDRLGWALFIGTPRGTNVLSELYYKYLSDPDWFVSLFTVEDTGAIDPDELESTRASMSEARYRQEFYCDFAAGAIDQLITLDQVMTATKRLVDETRLDFYPVIVGADIARYGDDRTVFAARQGPCVWPLSYHRGIDNMEAAARLARFYDQMNGDYLFVDAGRGEGVIDRLRQLGYSPLEVNFGGTRGVPDGFRNQRAYQWSLMAEAIREEACLPDDPELRAALTTPTYSYANAANVMELESKDNMKKRGLPSPDPADSLSLTWAQPVALHTRPDQLGRQLYGNNRGGRAKSSRRDFTKL